MKKPEAAAYWDTSALALLCTHQPATGQARRIAQRCRVMVTWWGSPVEARGAFLRLRRQGALDAAGLAEALKRLTALRRSLSEVLPTEAARQSAESMLDKYPLRAADAFQLGAAMVYCRDQPRGRWFVCFDEKLREAADLAGFTVLPG